MTTPLNDAEATRVGEVFEAHSRFIEAVARRHSRSPADVPDIVQTVGMHVCRKLRGFRGEAGITTWLYRITVNAAVDNWRVERSQMQLVREALMSTAMPDRVCDPDVEVSRRERADALRAAITDLRPLHRELMREELDGFPVLSNSKSIRHRARRRLREVLSADPRFA
jgi:RNA polymerase sigma-70 factor, ECF subfamily